jgi:hypothetical protein
MTIMIMRNEKRLSNLIYIIKDCKQLISFISQRDIYGCQRNLTIYYRLISLSNSAVNFPEIIVTET